MRMVRPPRPPRLQLLKINHSHMWKKSISTSIIATRTDCLVSSAPKDLFFVSSLIVYTWWMIAAVFFIFLFYYFFFPYSSILQVSNLNFFGCSQFWVQFLVYLLQVTLQRLRISATYSMTSLSILSLISLMISKTCCLAASLRKPKRLKSPKADSIWVQTRLQLGISWRKQITLASIQLLWFLALFQPDWNHGVLKVLLNAQASLTLENVFGAVFTCSGPCFSIKCVGLSISR